MIEAVLFDFNGVIIDDEPIQMQAYKQVLQTVGIALTEEDYYNSLGMDDRAFVRAAFERAEKELTDADLACIIAAKTEAHRKQFTDELPLFPGVVTFIKALGRRYPLGIVSMARVSEIEFVLERANISRFFDVVISAEDVRASKPDPDCYNQAFFRIDELRRRRGNTSLTPNECLVIEDSPPGIRAARAAGMRTLGVTNTVDDATLRQAGAEIVTANLADWTDDAVHHLFG